MGTLSPPKCPTCFYTILTCHLLIQILELSIQMCSESSPAQELYAFT